MEALFTPWRLAYLAGGGVSPADGCLFCALQKMDDADALVVSRGSLVYTALNRYPYSNGHVMVAPYTHRATLVTAHRGQISLMNTTPRRSWPPTRRNT